MPTDAGPAQVLYYYAGQQFDTGSPRSLANLIHILDRRRFRPLFLATGEGPLVDALRADGVEILRGEVRPITYRRPVAAVRQVREQAAWLRTHDIQILHVNELGWNLDLVLGAALAAVRVVLHPRLPETIHVQNLHRFAASRVIFCSRSQRDAVAGLHRVAHKSRVVYDAVDLELYQTGRSIRDRLGLPANAILVLCVAQVRHGKGIDLLLDATRTLLARWPELHVVVAGRVGEGRERFAAEMTELAAAPPLGGHVHFLGARPDVPDLLASADVFVLPTRGETFGRAVVEAMAAGVPVVASAIGGVTEIVTSAEVGRAVWPLTAGAFAEALGEVLALPDRGRAMGERGRQSLAGRFDRATIAADMAAVYAELLPRRD